MDKHENFFEKYKQIKSDEARTASLSEFMRSLSGEELKDFILGNLNLIKKDADMNPKNEKLQTEYDQLLKTGIATLGQLKRKEAA